MLFNAVSTLGLSRKLQGSIGNLQLELAKTSDEMASGKHFDVARQLGARTGQAIDLRGLYEQAEEDLLTIDSLDARFGLMDKAMSQIHDIAADVLALAATNMTQAGATSSALAIKARGALDEIVGLLNGSGGGNYLFSGIAVDTAPMRQMTGDDSGVPAPLDVVAQTIQTATGGPAVPQTAAEATAVLSALDAMFAVHDPAAALPAPLTHSYEGAFYNGASALKAGGAANARLSARPESGTEMAYGVQANDPYVRDIMQGLAMLAAIDTTSMPEEAYKPYMQAASDTLSDGITGLRDATATLGIRQATLQEMSLRIEAKKKVLAEQIASLENVDPTEASVRLSQLEQQVDMTASVTARIANMRLTEYL